MREFLLELYLQHGEREFVYALSHNRESPAAYTALLMQYIKQIDPWPLKQLTPKGLEYIKNLDNP